MRKGGKIEQIWPRARDSSPIVVEPVEGFYNTAQEDIYRAIHELLRNLYD